MIRAARASRCVVAISPSSVDEAGLAHAGLSGDHQMLGLSRQCGDQRHLDLAELTVASDHRRTDESAAHGLDDTHDSTRHSDGVGRADRTVHGSGRDRLRRLGSRYGS